MRADDLPPRLLQVVHCAQEDEPIDVVVEVGDAAPLEEPPSSSRAERIAVRKEAFAARAEPAEQAVRQVGGEVLERAWINRTLLARVPAGRVKELCRADGVANIDVTVALQPES